MVAGRTQTLTDESAAEQLDAAAAALREAMMMTLNKFARRKRNCARSKRWWTADLAKLRKELRRERRRPAGIGRAREARRNLRRVIRKAKKECWNWFLQEVKGMDVWAATRYTTPRIDTVGQALVAEDCTTAEGRYNREDTILRAHFLRGPPGTYDPGGGGPSLRTGGLPAGRCIAGQGSQHLGARRRQNFGKHHQGVLAVGGSVDHTAGPSMHPAGAPPSTVEDRERDRHPKARETGLLQGPGVPGNIPLGCHQQAAGTDEEVICQVSPSPAPAPSHPTATNHKCPRGQVISQISL